MDITEGLVRGQEVTDTGEPISVPVGPGTLGRIINVDRRAGRRSRPGEVRRSAAPSTRRRRPTPSSRPKREILVTGIKVVDLLAPYAKGGKIGLFGGAGVGKTVLIRS